MSGMPSRKLSGIPILDVLDVLDVSGLVNEKTRVAPRPVAPLDSYISKPTSPIKRTRRLSMTKRRSSIVKTEEIVLCHPIKPSPKSEKKQHPVLSSLASSPISPPRKTRSGIPTTADTKQTLEIWTKKANVAAKKKTERRRSMSHIPKHRSPTQKDQLRKTFTFSPKSLETRSKIMRKLLEEKVKQSVF